MDSEETRALNEEAEAINRRNATPALEEDTAEEVAEPNVEPTGEAVEEPTETAGEPKKGAQTRIRELNQKAKAAEERAHSLEQRIAELTNPVGLPTPQMPAYDPQEPLIAPGEEIDVTELNRRQTIREQKLLQQATANAHLIAKQNEAINRINNEASMAMRKYPELDPDNENFDEELSETIADAVLGVIQTNPYSASVTKFVDRLMKPYKGAVAKQVGQATENIAKQVSQAALRPTAIRKQEKTAAEKTIAELEAELGIVQS